MEGEIRVDCKEGKGRGEERRNPVGIDSDNTPG